MVDYPSVFFGMTSFSVIGCALVGIATGNKFLLLLSSLFLFSYLHVG